MGRSVDERRAKRPAFFKFVTGMFRNKHLFAYHSGLYISALRGGSAPFLSHSASIPFAQRSDACPELIASAQRRLPGTYCISAATLARSLLHLRSDACSELTAAGQRICSNLTASAQRRLLGTYCISAATLARSLLHQRSDACPELTVSAATLARSLLHQRSDACPELTASAQRRLLGAYCSRAATFAGSLLQRSSEGQCVRQRSPQQLSYFRAIHF